MDFDKQFLYMAGTVKNVGAHALQIGGFTDHLQLQVKSRQAVEYDEKYVFD